MTINIQDFRFLYQGKQVKPLLEMEASLLDAVDIRTTKRERALLLLHGFSSSPAVFRELIPAIQSNYDAVICPVLPGHSESIVAFGQITAQDWLNCAESTCETLLKDYQVVDVLGFSLGGLLACYLSQRFALNRLFLLAPALAMHRNVSTSLLLARALYALGFRLLYNSGGNLHTHCYPELTYRQLPIATIIEILTLINDFKWTMPSCPTELFLGRFDDVVDSYRVEQQFATASNTTTHWLEHSAHILPLDGDIDAIVNVINQRL